MDGSALTVVDPGDVEGMASAISETLERLGAEPAGVREARSEAERLFAPEVVGELLSRALERLLEGSRGGEQAPREGLDNRTAAA